MTYTEIVTEIKNAPLTWLAALFIVISEECITRKVFAPGGIERVLKNIQVEKAKQ